LFVWLKTVAVFIAMYVLLAIGLRNKNKNKSDSKIWKKLMMKYVSVFEFLLWFEFFFNNIKFIENNETLQNPHVLADKYIYVFSK